MGQFGPVGHFRSLGNERFRERYLRGLGRQRLLGHEHRRRLQRGLGNQRPLGNQQPSRFRNLECYSGRELGLASAGLSPLPQPSL